MDALSSLNGCVDGRNYFDAIDKQHQQEIREIAVEAIVAGKTFREKQVGDGPPEGNCIEEENKKLRN